MPPRASQSRGGQRKTLLRSASVRTAAAAILYAALGMTAPTEPSTWYDANATALARSYEAIEPEQLHSWLVDLLPPAPALVLDVGAGTGRDAAWLARLGH